MKATFEWGCTTTYWVCPTYQYDPTMTNLDLFPPPLAISMNRGKGAGVIIANNMGVWETCSFSLLVLSGPAHAQFQMYHLHLMMNYLACPTLKLMGPIECSS